MARSSYQKLKPLYIMKYLLQNTDEDHPVTVNQIISFLDSQGISAERKSIYSDIEALQYFGLDIVQAGSGRSCGYYVAHRDFELPELKLLVDSVQSSKFITHKKTLSLIRKIEGLASVHDARLLQRQVYVRNRVKSMNESVYYNVDEISDAISRDRSISFRYFEYTVGKERRFRRGGDRYQVSPFALMWDDENYYMLAWDTAAARLKHYRVDKMTGILVTEVPRQGREAFEQVDMSAYGQKVFGMFTGEERTVRLRFAAHLAGAVIDRFGKDVILTAEDGDHFTVSVSVAVSPQFYAWLFGFGGEVEILGPEEVRRGMHDRAAQVAALY